MEFARLSRGVQALCAATVVLPVVALALLGLFAVGFHVPPPLALGIGAAWIGARLLPQLARNRFSPAELQALRFWGSSAFLALTAAGALAALPTLGLALGSAHFGWSEQWVFLGGVAVATLAVALAAAVVWAAWRRLAVS